MNASVAAIQNNAPLDTHLHVVIVVSNPCQYRRRIALAHACVARLRATRECIVYVVEWAGEGQAFQVTEAEHPRHLQVRSANPLWHKENLINLGVERLLPPTWRAMAWIDADIEFDNPHWASDTLKILNGCYDVVQLWSHACDLNAAEETMQVFQGFGYQHTRSTAMLAHSHHLWHPGFAWAMTRAAFEQVGGLYDLSILGAGDRNMAMAWRGMARGTLHKDMTANYRATLNAWETRAAGLRLGYVPGVIRHYYHGAKINRQYESRWTILRDYAYAPLDHVQYDEQGVLVPTPTCPVGLLTAILAYFHARQEDD